MSPKNIIPVSVTILFIMVSGTFAATAPESFEEGTRVFGEGEYRKAIRYFERAINADPEMATAYYRLGLSHKALKTPFPEMIGYFQTTVELMPDFAEGHEELAKVYYNMGYFDKAEEHALKAVTLDPNRVSAKFALAWIYLLGKSDPAKAISYFQDVLSRVRLPYALYGLGIAYFMNHDRVQVLDCITQLRTIGEEDLASRLESMVRNKEYIHLQEGRPLVNVQPVPIPE